MKKVMARIESLDGFYFFKRSERKKAKKRKSLEGLSFPSLMETTKKEKPFLDNLGDEEAHGYTLEFLLDEVYSSGDLLKETQSLENIKKYKETVKAFLNYVVRRMLILEEKRSGVNILKRKRFIQIKLIDQKLQRLVTDILQNQHKQLEILRKVDEINGLLVNLLT